MRTYVPDYVFIRAERTEGWGDNEPFRGAPDLAIEILSPDDRMSRVMRKVRFYLENGVRTVWLIDPTRRTVEVLTEPGISRILTEDDRLDGGDVLPGFFVPVHELLPPRAGADGGTKQHRPPTARRRSRSDGTPRPA